MDTAVAITRPVNGYRTNALLRDFVAVDGVGGSVHEGWRPFLRTPRGEGRNGKRQPGPLPQNKDHLDPPLGVLRCVLICDWRNDIVCRNC